MLHYELESAFTIRVLQMTSNSILLIGIVLCAVAATTATAQVTLGPTMLYMPNGHSTETLTLVNASTEDKEVSITTRFGRPTSDTLGNVTMIYVDSTGDHSMDASAIISFYPRRFFLKGGTTQNVRFRGRPLPDMKHGMYWSRVVVTSSLAQDAPERQVGVDAQLQFECAQDIPLFFVYGSAKVNLLPRKLLAVRDSTGRSLLLVETAPDGNAPFVGSLGVVISQNRQVVVNRTIPVSLYGFERTQLLPENMQLAYGAYEVNLYWTMGRPNVLPKYASQFEPIVEQFTFGVDTNGNVAIK